MTPGHKLAAAIIVLLVTFWFGWRPFNFVSTNDFHLNPNTESIQINMGQLADEPENRGIAYTKESVTFVPGEEVELSLEFTPLAESSGLACIVTLDDNGTHPPLMIGQWQGHLVIRIADASTTKGYREVGVRNQLPINKTQHLNINFTTMGATFFVDGEQKKYFQGFSLVGVTHALTGQVVLGSNRYGTEPWHGNMSSFAIKKRIADGEVVPIIRYDFEKLNGEFVENREGSSFHLCIPKMFTPLQHIFLSPISVEELTRQSTKSDIAWNVFGFIPVSFCFIALMHGGATKQQWQEIVTVTLFAFLLSLVIETVQTYLPTRSSSQLDLLCNSAGGLLGGLVWVRFIRHK